MSFKKVLLIKPSGRHGLSFAFDIIPTGFEYIAAYIENDVDKVNIIDVEIRNADPSANPHLFFAAMIHSGLDGIKRKITYEPIEKNTHKMTKEELKDCGINKLPTNLLEALDELEKDDVLKQAIGRELTEIYVEKKKEEWHRYMSEITDVDYKFYFNC